jgi:hypothetical protein
MVEGRDLILLCERLSWRSDGKEDSASGEIEESFAWLMSSDSRVE